MTDETKTDIATALAEPFPANMLREHPSKGVTYVPGAEVIARLNRVLGVGGWSYVIKRTWEAGDQSGYPVWIMAEVSLSATVPNPDAVSEKDDYAPRMVSVARGGVGGQQVKMKRDGSGPVDLGDEYKGAVTDAVKKAAQSLGVALDLARRDEALEWELRYLTPKASGDARGRIAAAFDAMTDEAARKKAKVDFARRYGPPADLLAADEAEAVAFAEVATGVHLTGEPEAPAEAPQAAQEPSDGEPGPEGADEPLADVAALGDLRALVDGAGNEVKAEFFAWWRDNVGVPLDSGLVTEAQRVRAEEHLANL